MALSDCLKRFVVDLQALVSVAGRFLRDIPDLDDKLRANIADHMAFSHQSVTQASQRYIS